MTSHSDCDKTNCENCDKRDCEAHPNILIKCVVCGGLFDTKDLVDGVICNDCFDAEERY